MDSLGELESFVDRKSLIAAEQRTRVRETAEVGEGEIRRPVIDRIARGAFDSELRGNVGRVSEERQRLARVAAEDKAQRVCGSRAQRMAPAQCLAESRAIHRVAKSEQLQRIRIALLKV